MLYCLVALFPDRHIELIYWSDSIEDVLDGFFKYRVSGSSSLESLLRNYDQVTDVYIFKRLA